MARPVLYDDKTRERLLAAASRRVHKRGLEGLSLRGLARDTGTTTAAVYALYGGKDGLVAAVYERAVIQFAATLRSAPRHEDPQSDVLSLGLAYRESALADPHGYRVMFGGAVDPRTVPAHISVVAADAFRLLRQRVAEAQSVGALRTDVPASAIATSLWAHTHGLVLLELETPTPPDSVDPAALAEAALRAHLRGWAPATA
ncbi:MAG: TetR/AcrR family transcriptional regulator [Demequina sp.]|uniref:TetR/AcrR family transcriptional regulator n=1 Tax=Demequina sp. TaxID=2050685 RepID=UPI0019B55873|nr:TetR/AcrR family transcriptional regulator [Demequina sp.]MBC7298363.1 TetR/AcrR family transcriptional regulator [Demequina sp.]